MFRRNYQCFLVQPLSLHRRIHGNPPLKPRNLAIGKLKPSMSDFPGPGVIKLAVFYTTK